LSLECGEAGSDLGRRSMILAAEKVLPAVNAAISKGKRAAE
jgi:hypothetical protein